MLEVLISTEFLSVMSFVLLYAFSLQPTQVEDLCDAHRMCLPFSAAKMIPIFMMFAGGPIGTGKQWY